MYKQYLSTVRMRRWNLYQLLYRPHPSQQVVALAPSNLCAMVTFSLCSNVAIQTTGRYDKEQTSLLALLEAKTRIHALM